MSHIPYMLADRACDVRTVIFDNWYHTVKTMVVLQVDPWDSGEKGCIFRKFSNVGAEDETKVRMIKETLTMKVNKQLEEKMVLGKSQKIKLRLLKDCS